jgi:hypothetical protein
LEKKQPVSKDLVAVQVDTTIDNDGKSPSKEYYKKLVAKLMQERNAEG